jgi:hypothetical protein
MKESAMTESVAEEKNKAEMFKLVFDFLKHLTTLSSGSILLILTLAEKFFKDSAFSPALFQSLGAFAVSILAALVSMAVISFSAGNGRLTGRSSYWFAWGFVTSAIGFFGGMLLIVTAVFRQYG